MTSGTDPAAAYPQRIAASKLRDHLERKDAVYGEKNDRSYLGGRGAVPPAGRPTKPPPKPSDARTSLAVAVYDPLDAALNVELPALRDALAEMEVYIYETWKSDDRLTLDAARRFVKIADIFGWDMPWVDEMRAWSK